MGDTSNFFDILVAVVLKMDNVCYLAIITSILIVDFGRYLLGLLIKAPQDRAYEQGLGQGKVQGKAEGIAQERERWMDYDRHMRLWRKRNADAREHGEPFDEPMPKSPLEDD